MFARPLELKLLRKHLEFSCSLSVGGGIETFIQILQEVSLLHCVRLHRFRSSMLPWRDSPAAICLFKGTVSTHPNICMKHYLLNPPYIQITLLSV